MRTIASLLARVAAATLPHETLNVVWVLITSSACAVQQGRVALQVGKLASFVSGGKRKVLYAKRLLNVEYRIVELTSVGHAVPTHRQTPWLYSSGSQAA